MSVMPIKVPGGNLFGSGNRISMVTAAGFYGWDLCQEGRNKNRIAYLFIWKSKKFLNPVNNVPFYRFKRHAGSPPAAGVQWRIVMAKVEKKNVTLSVREEPSPYKVGDIVLYRAPDGRMNLDVRLERETLWLSLNQIADLFLRDKSFISRHLRNIYETGELARSATVAFFATVQNEGGREVERRVEYHQGQDVKYGQGEKQEQQRQRKAAGVPEIGRSGR